MTRVAFFMLGGLLYFGGRYFTYGIISSDVHAVVAILSSASALATYLAFEVK